MKTYGLPILVALVLVSPSVVWVARDHSIWWWDQSWYGENSIGLWATLHLTPGAWWTAMIHALGSAPPAIVWFGQFFVPLRRVGSMHIALLLSVETAVAVAFGLLFVTGRRLVEGRTLPALAGVLLVASAPLFFGITHSYLVEPIQMVSVIWVLFIMVSARRWHPSLTVAQLLAAVSFGLLTKLSTPIYMALAAAVALWMSFSSYRTRAWRRWWLDWRFLVSGVLAVVLAFAAASWYELNFHLAWQHAELSANDTLAGTQGPFLTHLERWIRRLIGALFQAPFGIALGAVLLAGVGAALLRRRRGSREPGSRFPLTMLAGTFVTVPVLLVLLAGQVNTDPRYVSPAIPAVGLALVALLRLLDIRLVTALVVLVLGAQFANVTLQNLYSGTPSALVDEDYRQLPEGRSATASELQRIVEATCTEETASKYNGVNADYFWLNGNTLTMLAFQKFALSGRRCYWSGLGRGETDPGAAWRALLHFNSPFLVSLDYGNPRNRIPDDLEYNVRINGAFNRVDAAVYRRALRSGRYAIVPGSRRLGVVLLRRTQS